MKTRSVAAMVAWIVCIETVASMWTGCSGDASPNAIRVGVAVPLTGSAAVLGEQMRMGAGLAMVQRTARGGIGCRPIELVYGDDRGRDYQAAVVANRFANDPAIVAVICHFNSACSLAGKPIYSEAGMVVFSPVSTNVDLGRGSKWTFGNLYADDYQAQSIAQYVFRTLGLKRAGVMYDNDAYGTGLKNAFSDEAVRIGLTLVGEEAYEREVTLDFSEAIDALSALGAV